MQLPSFTTSLQMELTKTTKICKYFCLGQMARLPSYEHKVSLTSEELPKREEVDAPVVKPHLIQHRKNDWFNVADLADVVEVAVETAISSAERSNFYLKKYIDKAFGLSAEDSSKVWRTVLKKIKEPDLKLSCSSVRAECSLQRKAGAQDWYCNLGILPVQHIKDPLVQTRNLTEWKKEGLIQEVFATSQQSDPQWNDSVELPLQKPADECLVVEVWNQEKSNGGDLVVRKGLKKIGNLLRHKEDGFVGRVIYSLAQVPSQALIQNLDMCSHSEKHVRGSLHILLLISGADAQKESMSGRLKEHRALLTTIVLYESKEDAKRKGEQVDLPPWDAQMDPAAESLIKFHAQFRSLSDFHQTAIRFSVLFSYYKANTLQLPVLESLLDSISKLPLDSNLSDNAERTLLSNLFDELQSLLTMTLNVLNNHLIDFNAKSPSSMGSLKEHLMIVKKLYSIDEFVGRLPSYLQSARSVAESAIQRSAVSWYSTYSAPLTVVISNELEENTEETLAALSGISKHILNECYAIKENMAATFMTLFDVDYLGYFLLTIDCHFERVARVFKNLPAFKPTDEERLLAVTYQMYVTFQELRKLNLAAEKRFQGEGQLNSCHMWFNSLVMRWIELAASKCKKGIIQAVLNDEVMAVTEDVQYSSSLVDTMTLFHNMVVFWKRLKWPDPEDAYGYLSTLIISITDAALYYVDEVYKKVDTCFSKDGKFIATVQLCIILNNMQTIQDKLSPPDFPPDDTTGSKPVGIIDELGLQEFFDWLEQERKIGLKLKEFVNKTMYNAADDIHHKICMVTSQLGKQFIPDIQKFMGDILQTCGGAPSVEDLQPLELYLNDNLKVLSANLLYSTFKLILKGVWEATVEILAEIGVVFLKKPNLWHAYRYTALSLKEYFHAGGDGLTGDDLDNLEFKAFLNEVDLRSQSTNSLILECCSNLATQQKIAIDSLTIQLGELTLIIGYLKPSSFIEVNVTAARNLPVDTMCFKPYVELQLWPAVLFEDDAKKSYRTSIHKQQTQNPQFGETFQMSAHSSLMQIEGTILSLVIYDYDAIGKDNFIGICVVACSSIPQFKDASELQRNSMTLSLPLFHITSSNVLQELVTRHQRSDEAASLFYTTLVKRSKAIL